MKISFLAVALLAATFANAQTFEPGQTYFSNDQFIEFRCGNLPFIFSAPHDGQMDPDTVPDRTCNNPVFAIDIQTLELAQEIDTAFWERTGCRPQLVICHLKRSKMDPNRDLADGACGDPDAEAAWNAFHDYLDTASAKVEQQFGRGFYIDIHGHGHPVEQLELGYLLSKTELTFSDSLLNADNYGEQSSIRYLTTNNQSSLPFSDLLRGDDALGTLLMNAGYPAVPSQQQPFPPDTQAYFNGGYNTARYSSYFDGTIDGVQIETNYTGVRDNPTNRKKFADSLVSALLHYAQTHMFSNNDFIQCSSTNVGTNIKEQLQILPNPSDGIIQVRGSSTNGTVDIFSVNGLLLKEMPFKLNQTLDLDLPNGVYLIRLRDAKILSPFEKLVIIRR